MTEPTTEPDQPRRQGQKKQYRALDRQIWDWSRGKNLTKRQIKTYASKLFCDAGISDFKASDGWYRRWMVRWRPCHHRIETESQSTVPKPRDVTPPRESPPQSPLDNQSPTQLIYPFPALPDPATKVKPSVKRYLPHFKSQVVSYALKHSIKAAALSFKVNKSTVADWIRDGSEGRSQTVLKMDEPSDVEFIQWLRDRRKSDVPLTQEVIRLKLESVLNSAKDHGWKSFWLINYADRFLNDTELKIHIMYPQSFKHEVAQCCATLSKKRVSQMFNIDRKRVATWVETLNNGSTKMKRKTERYVTDDKIDAAIWAWYKTQAPKPSSKQVRDKGAALYRKEGFLGMSCSPGWYYRWRKRYSLQSSMSERQQEDNRLLVWLLSEYDNHKSVSHAQLLAQAKSFKGTQFKIVPSSNLCNSHLTCSVKSVGDLCKNVASKTRFFCPSPSWAVRFFKRQSSILANNSVPKALEKDFDEFKSNLMALIRDKHFSKSNIIAFDEVPLKFSTSTLPQEKSLRKPGFDGCHASLIVSCSADGVLLPTAVILKSSVDQQKHLEDNVRVFTQKDAISDLPVVTEWLSSLLLDLSHSVLICDSYDPHKRVEVDLMETLKGKNVYLTLVPSGCSGQLPISSFTDAFKREIMSQWEKWQQESSWTGSVKLPQENFIIDWVSQAHSKFNFESKDVIRSSFLELIGENGSD